MLFRRSYKSPICIRQRQVFPQAVNLNTRNPNEVHHSLRAAILLLVAAERMKSAQSEAPATMSPTLAEVLKGWHQQTPYAKANDWIFASFKLKGRQPRTASILAADHLRPAAVAAGAVLKPGQRFGFQNLRHSLATFLINSDVRPN